MFLYSAWPIIQMGLTIFLFPISNIICHYGNFVVKFICLIVKTSCLEMKIIILDNRKTMKQYLHAQFFPHVFFHIRVSRQKSFADCSYFSFFLFKFSYKNLYGSE